MMRQLYTLAASLALPAVVSKVWLRGRRQPEYRQRLAERFGHYPNASQASAPCIWLHCVSVGETLAALPLIEALLDRGQWRLLVTTTTPTGSSQVQKALAGRVDHVYAPYDLPWAIHRLLDQFDPQLLLIMETELWPNTLHACAQRQIATVLMNGRLSARSARGYQRLSSLSRELLGNLSLALMQYPADAERMQALGMAAERLRVCGSIKFDIAISSEQAERAGALRQSWPHQHVWLAASTHPGEEQQLLAAAESIRAQCPNTLMVLAIRHPERAAEVLDLCRGLSVVTRSSGDSLRADTQVLLVDTLGELMMLYGCADVAFVGGSLVQRGGHNLVEPAAWGVPVLTGPSVFNFASMADAMSSAGALITIDDEQELAQQVSQLLLQPARREQFGKAAQAFARANRGALERQLRELGPLLADIKSTSAPKP